jgi:hypothetical protein
MDAASLVDRSNILRVVRLQEGELVFELIDRGARSLDLLLEELFVSTVAGDELAEKRGLVVVGIKQIQRFTLALLLFLYLRLIALDLVADRGTEAGRA